MPAKNSVPADDNPQIDRFKAVARELGCDESEAAFEEALRKVAQSKPLPKHVPKKRTSGAAEK